MLAKKMLTLFQKFHVDFFQIEIGRLPAKPIVVRIGMFGQIRFVQHSSRRYRDLIAVDEGVQPIRGWATGCSKESIKAASERSASDASPKVDQLHRLGVPLMNGLAVLVVERQSDMPFAYAGR